jgi:hypothetical protein
VDFDNPIFAPPLGAGIAGSPFLFDRADSQKLASQAFVCRSSPTLDLIMRGYSDITRATSSCLHFVDASEVDPEDRESFSEARAGGSVIVYLNCAEFVGRHWLIPSEIGRIASMDHHPYHEGTEANWVRWLDDLISLAHSRDGLVLVLDNAHTVFVPQLRFFTSMIEAFMIQFHHWSEREKPCHLCFQLSPTPLVHEIAAPSEV